MSAMWEKAFVFRLREIDCDIYQLVSKIRKAVESEEGKSLREQYDMRHGVDELFGSDWRAENDLPNYNLITLSNRAAANGFEAQPPGPLV